MTDRLVGLLGLGLRGRRVTVGVAGVRAGLQRDAFACVVLAAGKNVALFDSRREP